MARFGAIAAAGESVVRYLTGVFSSFPDETTHDDSPVIEQVTTKMFGPSANPGAVTSTKGGITLLLYRVDIDATQRNPITWSKSIPSEKRHALAVDLRYLLTAWADHPQRQQLILGRALAALAGHATFGAPDLVSDLSEKVKGIWRSDESFQFQPDEMATEDLYQLWESLGRQYELSVPFKARGIRLEADVFAGEGLVLERHLVYGAKKNDDAEEPVA